MGFLDWDARESNIRNPAFEQIWKTLISCPAIYRGRLLAVAQEIVQLSGSDTWDERVPQAAKSCCLNAIGSLTELNNF